MDRYQNKPLLRLLDCYLMDLIGELAPDQARTLVDLEPMLHRAWKSTGTWREMVEEQMGFQPTVREKVKGFWRGYIAAAEAQGLPAALRFRLVIREPEFSHIWSRSVRFTEVCFGPEAPKAATGRMRPQPDLQLLLPVGCVNLESYQALRFSRRRPPHGGLIRSTS
jgi:hypothetical protein